MDWTGRWAGLVDWTGGPDWWTGLVDWTGGLDSVDWCRGLDSKYYFYENSLVRLQLKA